MTRSLHFISAIGLVALAACSGCVIATEHDTVVESTDDDVHLMGTHLSSAGAIRIEAYNPTSGEYDFLRRIPMDGTAQVNVLDTDLYMWSFDEPIPAQYWQSGWMGEGARVDLLLTAETPGYGDVPLDVVTDVDWGTCLASSSTLDDFRDDCTLSTGEGELTIVTEDYCLLPHIEFHDDCLYAVCNDTTVTYC